VQYILQPHPGNLRSEHGCHHESGVKLRTDNPGVEGDTWGQLQKLSRATRGEAHERSGEHLAMEFIQPTACVNRGSGSWQAF
jgi:hypothetical protein